ncbi:hypothetical protein PACTADRAFT_44479 [Pachysolen tannophilus NRRL Y-2460]|uniref:NAD-dependent epimerase/dehydratase domain-containing protein n=1 Tax=Pachysolen tannophilus NRRL Y-2460 TaxID=669874 RepID=A0A1E4TRC7_PACTA|nr:hypothetical protein PACTADRAFT_44479 [Pachysolen tannophilus NRRL Y-2460]
MSATTVLVTGASGFVALHVVDVLLSKNYPVIGTVRSAEKGDKILKQFQTKYPNATLRFEIVKDIAEEGAFDEVLKQNKGIKYVLHTASPFSFGFETSPEDAYLKPAVEGTLNVLKAIKKYAPQVTNVIITSSFASVLNYDKVADQSFIHTEKTWNPITWEQARVDEHAAYIASKTLAEKAAWDFVEKEKPSFELTTLLPPYIFGPQVFEDALQSGKLNTSCELINDVLKTNPGDGADDPTKFTKDGLLSVDVRDVALFHVLAFEKNLGNKRLFPVQGKFSQQAFLNIVNKDFPELKGKIATGTPQAAEDALKSYPAYDNSESAKLTGVQFIPLEKSVVDTVQQILHYKKKHGLPLK